MKNWILLFISALMLVTVAHADTVTLETKGTGSTYEKAVEAALADAVRQANGASVIIQSETPKEYLNIKDNSQLSIKGDGSYTKDAASSSAQKHTADLNVNANMQNNVSIEAGTQARLDTYSSGQVKGYQVKERDCNPEGCTVILLVNLNKVERKTTQAAVKRDRIAILTTGNLRNTQFAKNFQQQLTDSLTKSERFVLLSRTAQNEQAFALEERFLNQRLSGAVDLNKSVLPADYLVIVDVTEAKTSSTVTDNSVNLTGEYSYSVSSKTRVTIRYSLIEAATHAIKWSDSTSFTQTGSALKKAQQQLSADITTKIINAISPAKIVGINKGKVIINRGDGVVKKGDEFTIFTTGELLFDPDTGENLGATEERVATIKLETVNAKVAYGYITSGQLDSIKAGDVARPTEKAPEVKKVNVKATQKSRNNRPANTDSQNGQQLGNQGGIIL